MLPGRHRRRLRELADGLREELVVRFVVELRRAASEQLDVEFALARGAEA
jgi:hypothetical protein